MTRPEELPQPQPTFQIVEGGTKRGKRKLIDSFGYTYNTTTLAVYDQNEVSPMPSSSYGKSRW